MTSDQLNTIWHLVLSDIQKNVSRANFLTLFKHTSLLSLEDTVATIAAPSIMIIDLLQKRFGREITTSLDQHTGQHTTLVFVSRPIHHTDKDKQEGGPLFAESVAPTPLSIGHLPRVRPDYTFSNFAVSSSNQVAWASATTVAANMGHSYNPLFIYGPVGVGKTHLMHAIANEVYQKQPDKKIIYITSEEFTNEVIDAIRTNDTSRMKKRFRSAYLLLIDDIQFIEGKERVQEELFHTFNILIDSGAQICLSSDRPPQEIKKLEKRLSSRFAGGLTVDIGPLDLELKTAILGIKAQKFGHDLPHDVALLLAEKAEDARSLEGLLLRVITQATTQNTVITVDFAQQILGANSSFGREGHRRSMHADDVINTVCTYYQLKPTQLKSKKRDAALVRARQVVMYLLKNELDMTLVEIGNLLGGRDHTTVMHGVEKMGLSVQNKGRTAEDIVGITRQLRG